MTPVTLTPIVEPGKQRIAGELPIEQCSEAALGRLMGGAGH